MGLYWYQLDKWVTIPAPEHYPGMERWLAFDRTAAQLISDRSLNIRAPLRMAVDPYSRIPDPAVEPRRSLEECCYERAHELLDKARLSGKPVYLLFSGGIDSTTVAVSFLKYFSHTELKDVIKIVTSTEAWIENPDFVRDHLLGKFEFISAHGLGHFTDGRALLVTGEMNEYYLLTSQPDTEEAYSRDAVFGYCTDLGMSDADARVWTELLDADRARACIPIATHREFLWWMRYNWTWHYNKFQLLMSVNPLVPRVSTIEEFNDRVHHFFESPMFQVWGMTSTDRSPRKLACRQFILEYTKDEQWCRDKRKFHSLYIVLRDKRVAVGVDENFNLLYAPEDLLRFYDPQNDFR